MNLPYYYPMFGMAAKQLIIIGEKKKKLLVLASQENVTYIDLYSHFVEPVTGKMRTEYSNDGLHLLGKGYKLWVEIIRPYVLKK